MQVAFHWYGLFVGLGIVVTWLVAEKKARVSGVSEHVFTWLMVGGLVGALIGARVWHVATDWSYYSSNVGQIWAVWSGGLSILGALLGGSLGLRISVEILHKQKWLTTKVKSAFLIVLDSLALGLPFGQAVGRMGNYFNQELYGLPTSLPWGIFIEPEYRVSGYEHINYFHPLFLYEGVGMLVMGAGLWLVAKYPDHKVGSGKVAYLYLLSYLSLRFCLEFLRLEKRYWNNTSIGINHSLIGVLLVVLFFYLPTFFSINATMKKYV